MCAGLNTYVDEIKHTTSLRGCALCHIVIVCSMGDNKKVHSTNGTHLCLFEPYAKHKACLELCMDYFLRD